MCAAARRLREQLGRRGIPLVLLGLGKVFYGLGFILVTEPNPRGLELLAEHGGIRCWATLWLVCGTITFASAWVRIGRQGWGFYAAMVPPFFWGAAFLWSAVNGTFPRGLTTFGWYMTSHIGMILWASTVPEHSVPHPALRKARR